MEASPSSREAVGELTGFIGPARERSRGNSKKTIGANRTAENVSMIEHTRILEEPTDSLKENGNGLMPIEEETKQPQWPNDDPSPTRGQDKPSNKELSPHSTLIGLKLGFMLNNDLQSTAKSITGISPGTKNQPGKNQLPPPQDLSLLRALFVY